MIVVRPATDADRDAWQHHLGSCASGDFLHDWEWAAVAAYDGEPQRRFVAEEAGRVVAIAAAQVRRTLAGRSFWYVPHGPVLDYADPRAGERLRAMLIALRDAARSDHAIAVTIEPRVAAGSDAAALSDRLPLRHQARSLQVGQTQLLDLSGGEEAVFAALDSQTRRKIRRAERDGVEVRVSADPADLGPIDELHALVLETQRRAGFPEPSLERYRIAWRGLAGAGRGRIVTAWYDGRPMAAGMLVVEGTQSFYLFAGSVREAVGEPKKFPSYAMQWRMIQEALAMGSCRHDLWGIAPEGAGPEHPWHGIGVFKKSFGGESVAWAGSWDLVTDRSLYRLRRAAGILRSLPRRVRAR
jgi:lipid II:glycine glycyltransferase (peptidoglycan interpeptide bridge formation enzyme)